MAPFWHRWSYFAIINLSVFHLADKCFTITNLINLRIILFLEYRKTPETLRFRGILRLDTMLSYDNKSIFRLYYSMIVATRPDPTVLPPSRTANQRPCPTRTFFRFPRPLLPSPREIHNVCVSSLSSAKPSTTSASAGKTAAPVRLPQEALCLSIFLSYPRRRQSVRRPSESRDCRFPESYRDHAMR